MTQAEELLEFVKKLVGDYNEAIRSYDFDARFFLADLVTDAWFLYVKYELKVPPGDC